MPELPEVETVRRGIVSLVVGQRFSHVVARVRKLRAPIPEDLDLTLRGEEIVAVERRAKYLLIDTPKGTLILHLGMSGSLRVVAADQPPQRHDHLDLVLESGQMLRLRDPRRFGAVWWTDAPLRHPALAQLGPEPLEEVFDADYLLRRAAGRQVAVKTLLMNQQVVVGVGNIYASEALFHARIAPQRSARTLTGPEAGRLIAAVKGVLTRAIEVGGTTLRDFQGVTGNPGYFAIELDVYGRTGEGCPRCKTPIRCERIGQRSSFFCPNCQS